jgi:rhamnulokinase
VLPIVTLCQLYTMARQEPDVLRQAATLLHIADLIHCDLCGVPATDWTLATASQLRNLDTGQWDRELMGILGIPHHMLPRLIDAPAVLGTIAEGLAPHHQLGGVPVAIAASHDTAAASAAAGPLDDETLFLSAGTYGMLGSVSDAAMISPEAVRAGCACVGLAWHRWGLFTSVMGMWVIQECCRQWEREGRGVPYGKLAGQAEAARIDGRIALAQPRFHAPHDMAAEVRGACLDAGLRPPEAPGEFAKVVFDSMVYEHREAAAMLASLTGRRFRRLHVVSGGSQNAYLCQRLADALGLPVMAGPAEAAAAGNILVQASLMGCLHSGQAAWHLLSTSTPITCYEPKP